MRIEHVSVTRHGGAPMRWSGSDDASVAVARAWARARGRLRLLEVSGEGKAPPTQTHPPQQRRGCHPISNARNARW